MVSVGIPSKQDMSHFRLFFAVIAGGIFIDLLSIIAWADPRCAIPIVGIILVVVAYASFRDLSWGVVVVFMELLWGSHGHLFNLTVGGISVSLRMWIFAVVLAATCWGLRKRSARDSLRMMFRTHPARVPLAFLALTFSVGLAFGLIRHPLGLVFHDANAWLFFALLPAFLLAGSRMMQRHRADDAGARIGCLSDILFAGAAYLIIRFAALLFVFSHDTGDLAFAVYRWVRDTRLGEVTFFANGFPRVFLPSIALLFPMIGLAFARMRADHRVHTSYVIFVGGAAAVIVASFSRSFWLGGVFTLAVLVCIQAAGRVSVDSHMRRIIAVSTLAVVLGVGFTALLVKFPYPPSLMESGFARAVADRFTIAGEAAVSNREQEIVPLRRAIERHAAFGNGFGATVTYDTRDPRTLADHPDGRYTAYAFEWGYLDHALETGLLGLGALLWLLATCIVRGWRRGGEIAGLAVGLMAIAVVHVTSPYLNHPIGIGVILWLFAVLANTNTEALNGAKLQNIS